MQVINAEKIEVNWHGHQDRGLGVANNIAAVRAGADVIHGTALGVGERAGNAPLDQTLVNLKLMGVIENDLTMLDAYMQKANEYIEVPLPRNYPVFGEMPLKLEQAFTPRRSSKPCERAMIGLPTESIPVSPLEISDSSRSFESVICPGGQTSSGGWNSKELKPKTSCSPLV